MKSPIISLFIRVFNIGAVKTREDQQLHKIEEFQDNRAETERALFTQHDHYEGGSQLDPESGELLLMTANPRKLTKKYRHEAHLRVKVASRV